MRHFIRNLIEQLKDDRQVRLPQQDIQTRIASLILWYLEMQLRFAQWILTLKRKSK